MQTPCYSNASTYLLPEASTPPNYLLIGNAIFSRSYRYAGPLHVSTRSGLGAGSIAGIVVTVVFVLLIIVGVVARAVLLHRRTAKSPLVVASKLTAEQPAPTSALTPGPHKSEINERSTYPFGTPRIVSRTLSCQSDPSQSRQEVAELDIGDHPAFASLMHAHARALRSHPSDHDNFPDKSEQVTHSTSPTSTFKTLVVSPDVTSSPTETGPHSVQHAASPQTDLKLLKD